MPLKSHALTTVDAVRDELGLSGTSADARLERMINAASARFAAIVGRDLHYAEDVVEDVAGYDRPRLAVRRTPLLSILSITPLDASGSAGTALDDESYFIEDAERGWIGRSASWSSSPASVDGVLGLAIAGTERRNWRVTYTGGSITPFQESADGGSLGTSSLRDDIEQAIIESVVDTYRRAGARSDILSERLGDESVTYANPGTELTDKTLSPSARALAISLRAVW